MLPHRHPDAMYLQVRPFEGNLQGSDNQVVETVLPLRPVFVVIQQKHTDVYRDVVCLLVRVNGCDLADSDH